MQHLAVDHGVEAEDELHTLLCFYHSLGSLLYFGHIRDSPILANTVILRPSWLAQKFRALVGTRPAVVSKSGAKQFRHFTRNCKQFRHQAIGH